MSEHRRFWAAGGTLLLLVIVAAAFYLRREFTGVRSESSGALSVRGSRPTQPTRAEPKGASKLAATPPPATPSGEVVLRGSDVVPRLELPATVARLQQEVGSTAPRLQEALGALLSRVTEERSEAVGTLGFSEDVRFLAPIAHLLRNDPDAQVRASAASALELYRGKEVAAALAQALTDPEEEVRENSLLSLQVQRDNHAERELRTLLKLGDLDEETALDVRLFLDRHYVRKDPFKDPVGP
jgi:hypothetical protein